MALSCYRRVGEEEGTVEEEGSDEENGCDAKEGGGQEEGGCEEGGSEGSASQDSSELSARGQPSTSSRQRFVHRFLRPKPEEVVRRGIPNPFVNPNEWNCYEVAKLLLLGPWLLPLRIVLLVILLVLAGIVSRLATCGFPLKRQDGCVFHEEALPGWRQMLLRPLACIVQLMLLCFGFFCVEVEDHRCDDDIVPNIIVVSPHLTDIDILMLHYAFGSQLSALGDRNILKAPFVNWIGEAGQNVFVDLSSPVAKEACKGVIQTRAGPDWEGPPLAIFPEGRITNGRVLIQFRAGAFTPGKPVLPVVLRYPHRFFDPTGQSRANRSFFWPIRILTQFCNYSKVEILRPYLPSLEEQQDPIKYSDNVRAVMAQTLGVGVTNHSYQDAQMFREALTVGLTPEAMDFEFDDIHRRLAVDVEYLTNCMREFKEKDINGDGSIDRDEFVMGYRKIAHLFDFFDHDSDQKVCYVEMVHGLAVLSGKASPETRAKLVFHSRDEEDTGSVRGTFGGSAWGPFNFDQFLKFADTELGRNVVEAELARLTLSHTSRAL